MKIIFEGIIQSIFMISPSIFMLHRKILLFGVSPCESALELVADSKYVSEKNG
jgi:hypothetical protein